MTDDATDRDPQQTPPASPSPRPRSAASRARRIGGAAATPRPDTGADTATTKPTPAASTRTVELNKKPDATGKAPRSTEPAGGRAASVAKASAKPGTVTFSVPGWLRWAPTVVFTTVAVVFLTLFAVSRFSGSDTPASLSPTLRQEVLAAAKTCLATLNTYRYDQLDQAEAAGTACTTGKLTTDYRTTVTNVIRKNAPTLKAVQVAKINTAGIESVTSNGKQWTVLAYGQLNITTVNQKQGRIDPFAVVARLEQANGKWLLAKVDTVSSASA